MNDTQYLAITGELWGVVHEWYKDKWPWYIETALYCNHVRGGVYKLDSSCLSVCLSIYPAIIHGYYRYITVSWHYKMVQYDLILHTALEWMNQNIYQNFNPQNRFHNLPSVRSYGLSLCMLWIERDRIALYWWMYNWTSMITLKSKCLTHCGLVTPYGDINLGQHWLR